MLCQVRQMLLKYKQVCVRHLPHLFTNSVSGNMLWFGWSRQKKRHAATSPPAGVWRRMEKKKQKPVGQDKGSWTEQQTKGNSNNNNTDKENAQSKTESTEQHSPPAAAACSRAATEFPPPSSPPPERSIES